MDNFCVLPWFGREISWDNHETHCCLLPLSYDIKKIRQDMLEGRRPVECQKCWKNEDHNIVSDRQLKNAALDFYWDRDLQFIYEDAKSGFEKILMLKVVSSYTCNATCISCGPHQSSSWAELVHRTTPSIPIKPLRVIDLEALKKRIDFKNLKMLSIIGGEPFYEKKNLDLLEYILELGNDSIFISAVTNGSVRLTERQKQVLSRFRNLNINISIDGVGPVFEYLRFPLEWDVLLENLAFFRSITDNISSTYTISNLNILYHTQTVKWFNENKVRFFNNPIYSPEWLQPRALPVDIKKMLKEKLSPDDYLAFIGDSHTERDQINFENFLIETKKQDIAKGIKMQDYLPELYDLLTNINST